MSTCQEAPLLAAFEGFDIEGDVLELACGPGRWTEKLAERARSLTAIDASPEMIERARARVEGAPVRFVQADLFAWRPQRRYDAVFFGFWLSHVLEDCFAPFWDMVAASLKPSGTVFFVDDNHRSEAELIEGAASSVVERRSSDGTPFRAIKVPHQPVELTRRLAGLGWDASVDSDGMFYWGSARLF